MKSLLVALGIVITCGSVFAQASVWQPSLGHMQVWIWPANVPDARPVAGPESMTLVASRPYQSVTNVSQPTMTVYRPTGKNTGAAIVVFPGGGYQILAIDLEGTEICNWLVSQGITAVLLKYRVPLIRAELYSEPSPLALEDAQRTLGLVRLHCCGLAD